ncbi:hypothetical protein KI387_039444, partial [Taxus chinensis]
VVMGLDTDEDIGVGRLLGIEMVLVVGTGSDVGRDDEEQSISIGMVRVDLVNENTGLILELSSGNICI